MDKKTNKKMKILVAAAAVLIVLAVCFLILGGKRDDVMIEDFSVSADGSEMTLKAGIAGSAGYLRKAKVRYDDEHKTVLVDFYSTFGINNPVGAEDTFVIPLKPDSENIFFNRGTTITRPLRRTRTGDGISSRGSFLRQKAGANPAFRYVDKALGLIRGRSPLCSIRL